ncbi:MAG: hypothetical protein Q4D89_13370 [Arachnia propionica]|uniref:hypothetical protein n=1 Tax=Arachnia propionica TaxID=1750 RepID=UPI00270F4A2F|nr:hypothetical protein [Arachnia propionica]
MVPFPESWQASLDAAPRVERGHEVLPLQDEGFIHTTKDAVHREVPGDQPRLLHSPDSDIEKPVTDGRHVVFRMGSDLLAWDSKHPDQPVRSVTDDGSGKGHDPDPHLSFHDISEGQLWYRDAEDTGEEAVGLFHADLNRGRSLYPAHVFANAWFGATYRGSLQYTRGHGVWVARPSWSSSQFWGPIDHAMVVNHSGSVHLLSARLWELDEARLWGSSTGETIESGVADSMAWGAGRRRASVGC